MHLSLHHNVPSVTASEQLIDCLQTFQQSLLLPFLTSQLWAVHVPTYSSILADAIHSRGDL